MLFRKAAVILTVVLVLAVLGMGVWFWKTQNRLYSSPTAIRTNGFYLRAHSAPTNAAPVPTNLYSSILMDRTTNRIELAYPEAISAWNSSERDYLPMEIVRADMKGVARVGEGTVTLAGIGTAIAEKATNFGDGVNLPARYFTADGKALGSPPEMLPEHERKLYSDGKGPAAQFVLISSNLTALKSLRLHVFDARTHFSVMSGHSMGTLTNGFYYGTTLELWHQTPLELVATIATGPIETYSMKPTEGAEAKFPGGNARLLVVSEKNLNNWSSRHDGRTNLITYRLGDPSWPRPPRAQTSLLLHVWPTAFAAPIEIEVLGEGGKKLQGGNSGTSGNLMKVTVDGVPEDIREVRLKYYTRKYRVIFDIPELPGLPEENRNVENLFDVRIPYMNLRYEYDFQYGIGKLLQMSQGHYALNFPNGYFPTKRTNTTPRELFLEMEGMLANKESQLVADPQKNEIRESKQLLLQALEKFQKMVGID
jgi:hypothetical protein